MHGDETGHRHRDGGGHHVRPHQGCGGSSTARRSETHRPPQPLQPLLSGSSQVLRGQAAGERLPGAKPGSGRSRSAHSPTRAQQAPRPQSGSGNSSSICPTRSEPSATRRKGKRPYLEARKRNMEERKAQQAAKEATAQLTALHSGSPPAARPSLRTDHRSPAFSCRWRVQTPPPSNVKPHTQHEVAQRGRQQLSAHGPASRQEDEEEEEHTPTAMEAAHPN
ncbi:hypothetical protein PLESTB_001515900 [Pleodorina starrii]|uniref:Uncharacterized protein n=1 Tax=Pleodorina starrii TaxID=330485 RepID=A0A9W6BY32_9CHLO|nr:hypothetical protein PLESTB_001515900 [Pleodorina starrii]